MDSLARLDHLHLWHPFTQMRDWLDREPIVIVEGRGAVLRDSRGREYLDGNSSIWTNLHGHNHPRLNAALGAQARRIAHSSALGLANEPASRLAARLVSLAAPAGGARPPADPPAPRLEKVFFSDDGSTAIEVALKLAHETARRLDDRSKPRVLSLDGAYHGDTIGAVSAGHIDLFHQTWSRLLFRTDKVMAPYCYRCRFNRASPQRQDARDYRRCGWECLDEVEKRLERGRKSRNPYTAFFFEPLVQGAAGIIPQPPGWLRRATDLARGFGARLVADEVMTGFGRTGCHLVGQAAGSATPGLFACQAEGVVPDFLAVAKGLTGGYLPMAATLTTAEVFGAFLGEYEEFRTFFHGHSFTGNQLGAATALASLDLLEGRASVEARRRLEAALRFELARLWDLPQVGDVRQVGLVVGVELVSDWRRRTPFDLRERAGIRVCEAMVRHGVLTRPVGNVVVLIPPYCTMPAQARQMVAALHAAIRETLGT